MTFPLAFAMLAVAWPIIAASEANDLVPARKARIDYRIEYIAPQWRVTITATALNASGGSVALELADFGSWTNLADYYLARLTVSPPASPDPEDPTRWIIQPPDDWDGTLRAEYFLHAAAEGTVAQRAHALLPVRSESYTYGCTQNTLMALTVKSDEKPSWTALAADADRGVSVVPPDGWLVFSGWGGESAGPQTFEMTEFDRNGLIVFGQFTSECDRTVEGISIEVRQFGKGPPSGPRVAEWLARLAPLMAATMGVQPDPIRVFLTDSADGGMMTDRGLMVGIRQSWTLDDVDAFSTRHLVAHELFHGWLGGMLRPPKDMVWFLEGFTDYVSLWHAAASGTVPQEWFVRRLGEFAAAAKDSSLGRVSFIDKDIAWRDGDGPNERMAYAGAHVVAFALDVELRQRGQGLGVLALLADLLGDGGRPCTKDDLRAWFVANEALDLWDKYIAGRTVPDVDALLEAAGCKPGWAPVELTYLGIRATPQDPDQPLRNLNIVELDPDGPAARAGARVGDVITGWFPFRSEALELGPEVTTPFTFGLTNFTPRESGAYIGVLRGGEEIKLDIVPVVIRGGRRPQMAPGPEFEAFLHKRGQEPFWGTR